MIYLPFQPAGALAGALDAMFYVQGYSPEHSIERLVPDAQISIIIELDGQERFIYDNATLTPMQTCRTAWVSGMHTGYLSISALQKTELIGIRFKPGTAYPYLKTSLEALQDRVVPAKSIFGEGIVSIRKLVRSLPSPDDKLATLAAWLDEVYDATLVPNPLVSDAVANLIAHPTVPTLQEVLVQRTYSKKHFTHLFKKFVGLSPKALQRILRFTEVLPLIQQEQQINWAQISAECGYYDQSHFIRDFLHFSGYNPKAFLDEDHDRPNFFPIDSPG